MTFGVNKYRRDLDRLTGLIMTVLGLCSFNLLFADVGESVDEVLNRYGKENLYREPMNSALKPWTEPHPPLLTRRWFKNGDVISAVSFFGGKSVCEEYYPATRGDLSPKQIEEYLAANSDGSVWKVTERRGNSTWWSRTDGKLLAWKHSGPPGLRFYSPNFHQIFKKDAEERKRRIATQMVGG